MERSRVSEISKTEYEVFLSFRGPDTRQGFTDVLYDHLIEGGIQVFRDDDELAVGDNIELILDAINSSKICVPVFSNSFASSAWCLREVAKMVELNKDIAPIFYDVTPDDVKLKTPLYVDQLREQHKKYGIEQVEEWEKALMVVSRIKGRELKETGFVKFSKQFKAEVLLKLGVKQKYTINHFVEMTDQIESAMKFLDIESADVRFLGMYGMGGIGKTNLAKIIFNRISSNFDACSFLANIREERNCKGLESLQKKLLQDLNPKASDNTNTADWPGRMKRSLRMKSVLIVLDDVGERSHITELVGDCSSFGSRSRIIITSRDERVFLMNVGQTSSSDEVNGKLSNHFMRMQIKAMNPEQAMQLFCRHAFGSDSPPDDYTSLSKDVISISGGLPLALEVIGSLLCSMSIPAWKDKISKLKKIPAERVQEKLMISYEALDDDEKEIFLDIAWFFINVEISNAMYMWEACDFHPNWAVSVLLSMSLVKITGGGKFWMHDQLRDLGREIVRTKGYCHPSSREGSRMLTHEDAFGALEKKKGKEVLGLRLDTKSHDTLTDLTSFESLRFLKVTGIVIFGNFWKLPENLRWLSLCLNNVCLIDDIRSKFSEVLRNRNSSYMMKLVVLDLSWSTIKDDWQGWTIIQELRNLKVLDLGNCSGLTRTPNFSKMAALEKLVLRSCLKLAKIHSSIGKLRKLKYLNLEDCYQLRELPKEIGNLEEVEQIIMTKTLVTELPESIGKMKNLMHFSLRGCRLLDKLPESIGDLTSLVHLCIDGSGKLKELPEAIGRLVKLKRLSLSSCRCINKLPDSIGDLASLVHLDISFCQIDELPSSVTRLLKLEWLSLNRCKKIVKLPDEFCNFRLLDELYLSYSGVAVVPDSIGDLARLKVIDLKGTPVSVLPETIAQLSHLQSIDLSECHCINRLPKLPASLTVLKLKGCSLQQAPDLSELIRLRVLTLDDVRCRGQSPQLGLEPVEFDAIRNLSRLVDLDLELEGLSSLPAEFSALTRLKFLRLSCPNLKCAPQFPSSLQRLTFVRVTGGTELPCLSNLNNLSELVFEDCSMEGGIFRSLGFERLESVTRLKVFKCGTIDIFPDLSQLKCLEELEVRDCEELVEISGLGTLVSLTKLEIYRCGSLERIENMKNLTSLRHFLIKYCKTFGGIEGHEKLRVRSLFRIWDCKCKDFRPRIPFKYKIIFWCQWHFGYVCPCIDEYIY